MTKDQPGWRGQRGTRHERGYGAAWVKVRRVILNRDMHLCQPCREAGRITTARTVDHIKPKAEGGADDPDNLRAICSACHASKTTAEGHRAAGHEPRKQIGLDGWPVE